MHVDKKFDRDVWTGPLKALKSELEARRRPRDKGGQLLFDSVFDLRWASWSMIEPTLYVMERVLRPDAPPWDLCVHRARRRRAARGADDAEALRAALSLFRFINLAGDSLPVLTPAATRARLAPLRAYNFVTCSAGVTGLRPTAWHEFDASWHKRTAYPDPMLAGTALEAHYGSQWMIATRAFSQCELARARARRAAPRPTETTRALGCCEPDARSSSPPPSSSCSSRPRGT